MALGVGQGRVLASLHNKGSWLFWGWSSASVALILLAGVMHSLFYDVGVIDLTAFARSRHSAVLMSALLACYVPGARRQG